MPIAFNQIVTSPVYPPPRICQQFEVCCQRNPCRRFHRSSVLARPTLVGASTVPPFWHANTNCVQSDTSTGVSFCSDSSSEHPHIIARHANINHLLFNFIAFIILLFYCSFIIFFFYHIALKSHGHCIKIIVCNHPDRNSYIIYNRHIYKIF